MLYFLHGLQQRPNREGDGLKDYLQLVLFVPSEGGVHSWTLLEVRSTMPELCQPYFSKDRHMEVGRSVWEVCAEEGRIASDQLCQEGPPTERTRLGTPGP